MSFLPQGVAGGPTTKSSNDVVGHNTMTDNPSGIQRRHIQPHKILLRGESSTTAVNPIIPERISRPLPSIQQENAKLDTAKAAVKALITTTFNLENLPTRHVEKVDTKKTSRAKNKGPACSLKRPLSANFKWVKPVSKKNSQPIKKGKE